MPIKVPGEANARSGAEGPSEVDLLMALATMHQLGRIPTFNERFRGQDPSSLPLDVRQEGPQVEGQVKGMKNGVMTLPVKDK